MEQVHHGSATHDGGGPSSDTVWSREPAPLAKHCGINQKTLAK